MTYSRVVWQYWENSQKYPNGIPYIDLCQQSVELHQSDGKGYKLIRLNPRTITHYIKLHPLLQNVSGDSVQLAQKADYIRARLLATYGGVWLDSDVVVLREMDSVFEKLERTEFYGFKEQNGDPSVWAFACHRGSQLATKWADNNDRVLDETNGLGLGTGEMGHKSIAPFIEDDPKINLFDPQSVVQPIDHLHAWKYLFFKEGLDEYLHEEQPFYVFNNHQIDDYFREYSPKQLRETNNLMVQILERAGVVFTLT